MSERTLVYLADVVEVIYRALRTPLPDYHKAPFHNSMDVAMAMANEIQSAHPECKRGRWRHYEGYLTCSECGTEYDDDIMTHFCDDVPQFCPNCGADMRGGEEE